MVNIHYCMGDLSSVNYGVQEDDVCGTCGMKEKKGCCHTEYKFVKLQDAHQMAKEIVSFAQTPAMLPSGSQQPHSILPELAQLSQQYHAPPNLKDNDIYLKLRVFRI